MCYIGIGKEKTWRKKVNKMLIYITLATMLFLGGFAKQSKKIYKCSLIALLLLTAFRKPDWGGFDSIVYMNQFSKVPTLNKLHGFQSDYGIGYILLNSISKTITDNYIFFQVLLAVITIILLNLVIEKAELTDSEKCFFLFSYFCYRFMWNTWVTYRQNIANLIVWLLIVSCWKKRTVKGNVVLIGGSSAASVFHSSAWANFILIPGAKIIEKISVKKRMILLSCASIFLWIFGGKIFQSVLSYAMTKIDSRYGMYALATLGTSNVVNYIFRLLAFLWLCYAYKNLKYEMKDVALSTLAIMLLLGSLQSELMLRIYEYYAIGLYLTLATCISYFKGRSKIIAAVIFYLVMMVILIRGTLTFSQGVFATYQSCFF